MIRKSVSQQRNYEVPTVREGGWKMIEDLRFVPGDFGNIKYKLQHLDESGRWVNVHVVEEEQKCPCCGQIKKEPKYDSTH